VGLSRSVFCYRARLQDDAAIEDALKKLADKYKRYGFRKIFHKIRTLGFTWNRKRVYRVYRSLKLNLKIKPKKRLLAREKITLREPIMLNNTWSLDYMSDACMDGKRFRTINVIDDCSRESLGIKASRSLPSYAVTAFLDEIAQHRGKYPQEIRMDNGPENIAKNMKIWAKRHNIKLSYIQPGKPAQNGYIERFNRTYREEVLDMYLFRNLQEVQRITNEWISEYNSERPHHSLGNLTPHEYAKTKFSTFKLY
jgi:putative transposase